MAAFCQLFPWCSPTAFWDLDLSDYFALKPVVDQAKREAANREATTKRKS